MNSYFISNDDVACKPIYTTLELDHDSWPIVITAPSAELKAPKYDWKNHAWVENAAESQGQRISALEGAQKSLDESVQKLTQNHTATVQANQTLTTQINGLQKLTVQTNANVAQMMSMMNKLTQSQPDKKEEGTN
jgi:hypothetical protein